MQVRHGTSRAVVLTERWAVKLPWGLSHKPVRGWLANRSEWRQRDRRPNVCRPRWTFGHVALVMPRANYVGDDPDGLLAELPAAVSEGDEAKASSWGWFGDRWLLIDFDRSWEQHDRGLVGRAYWGNQERLARKWSRLSASEEIRRLK